MTLLLLGSSSTVAPVAFTGHLGSDLVWGSSRRWNAWVEFLSGKTLVASSAVGDFAVTAGKVTEDISRSIRRDVQVSLTFPLNPQRRTVAVYASVTSGSALTVGSSNVGGSHQVGGSNTVTQEIEAPSVTSDTARSVFVPTNIGDLLDPHSLAVMRIYAGYEGEEQLLGYFDLAETDVTVQAGEALVQVTGHSFERRVDLAGFWIPVGLPDSTPVVTAASMLVRDVISDVKITATTSGAVIGGDLKWGLGDNRLKRVGDVLAIGGLEGGFERNNDYVIQQAPTSASFNTQSARWDIIDGLNARVATLNSAARKFSDEDSFNGVVVEGTSRATPDAPPVYAARWNTNPASPLYFDPARPTASAMGPRPKHISSELVKTEAEAVSMAYVELAKVLMVTDSVEAEVPAHAKLEMGQYARLVSDALGVDAVYRLNRVVHDLSGGPAQVTLYRFTGV